MDKILEWANLIYVIVGIVITVIPFAIALFKAVKIAVKNKQLGAIIIEAMQEAELNGGTGDDKLNYVLDIVEIACKKLGVKFDKEKVIKQIEELIKLSKVVNVNTKE